MSGNKYADLPDIVRLSSSQIFALLISLSFRTPPPTSTRQKISSHLLIPMMVAQVTKTSPSLVQLSKAGQIQTWETNSTSAIYSQQRKLARNLQRQRGDVVCSSGSSVYQLISLTFYRTDRNKNQYTYLHSPTSPTATVKSRNPPLSQRLRALQSELASLEEELSDPSNPSLQRGRDEESLDPGELIRGLVDVRGRLEKIRKEKEGRSRLVGVIIGDAGSVDRGERDKENQHIEDIKSSSDKTLHSVVDMDRRVGELEKLVGASSATLDEVSTISNATSLVLTTP